MSTAAHRLEAEIRPRQTGTGARIVAHGGFWDLVDVGSPIAIDRCGQGISDVRDDHEYVGNLLGRPLPVLVGSRSISRHGRPLDRAARRLVLSR